MCSSDLKDEFVVRKNNKWWYKGFAYRSLRHLKTSSSYKFYDRLGRKLADEIRREIDADIIAEVIKALA